MKPPAVSAARKATASMQRPVAAHHPHAHSPAESAVAIGCASRLPPSRDHWVWGLGCHSARSRCRSRCRSQPGLPHRVCHEQTLRCLADRTPSLLLKTQAPHGPRCFHPPRAARDCQSRMHCLRAARMPVLQMAAACNPHLPRLPAGLVEPRPAVDACRMLWLHEFQQRSTTSRQRRARPRWPTGSHVCHGRGRPCRLLRLMRPTWQPRHHRCPD